MGHGLLLSQPRLMNGLPRARTLFSLSPLRSGFSPSLATTWRQFGCLPLTQNPAHRSGLFLSSTSWRHHASTAAPLSTDTPQDTQNNSQSLQQHEDQTPVNAVDVPAITDRDCFAVVQVSGKQQKVVSGDVILTEKLVHAEVGNIIRLDKVLLLGTTDLTVIGTPRVQNAFVMAEVQEQTKAEKVIIFKKKRRKGYQKKRGYRASITVLRILDVHYDLGAVSNA